MGKAEIIDKTKTIVVTGIYLYFKLTATLLCNKPFYHNSISTFFITYCMN